MPDDIRSTPRGADLLSIIFGTTLVIWSVLYVAAVPPGFMPPLLTAGLIGVVLLAGGFVTGRAGRGWRGGLVMGLGVGCVGLLILASLLQGASGAEIGRGMSWAGGFIAGASILGAAGAAMGHRAMGHRAMGHRAMGHRQVSGDANWTARFALVAVATLLAMVISGGVVTGLEAGLAVEGWLNAEGHFLPLFPLELMRRDVPTFVEHAHRLWGLLVGLTTIVLAVHIWMVDRRGWLRGISLAVVLVVVAQGVLGGTRVTEASVPMGIIHGILAQVILATLLVIAAAVTAPWMTPDPAVAQSRPTNRTMSVVLVVALLIQVTLGTVFRHLQPDPETPRGALAGMLHGHAFVGSTAVIGPSRTYTPGLRFKFPVKCSIPIP